MRTVTNDVAILILCHGTERGPLGEVLQVVVDVVILRQRVQVGQVHMEEIRRLHRPE